MSNQDLIAKGTTQIPADIKGMWGEAARAAFWNL
jgi:hypothetical protein